MQSDNVYFNLHKSVWSIKRGGRVREHAAEVMVLPLDGKPVRFVVSEPGRQRVLREKRKNVHAYVRGNAYLANGMATCNFDELFPLDRIVQVSYNPYRGGKFYRKDTGAEVSEADAVYMTTSRVLWAVDPR